MQKNVYFLIRNTVNAAKHKLRWVEDDINLVHLRIGPDSI